MAEETSSSAVKSYPNKFWNPYRYYAMGAYVMMYNAIKNNPIEYGIGQQNFDIQINQYIKDHFDELSAKLGFKFQTYQSITGVPMPSKYSAFSLPYVKEDFLNDFDALVGEARRLSAGGYGSTNEKGATTMMSVDSLQKFLSQDKEKDAKGYYENIRNVYKYKSENVDPKTGKPKSGEFAVAARNAEMEYGDKKRLLRRTGWQLFGRGLLSVLGIGVTAVSVVSVLSGGGLALGAIFGSTLRATGLGRVFAGLVGSVGGWFFTKKAGTKFFEKWGERKGYREDFRDFMDGVGKYATKDGKPQGYKGPIERYKCAGALLNYMNLAGSHWKELWGFGPGGKPTLTYEDLLKKMDKEDRKYLQEKNNPYIKRYGDLYLDNFSLKKLAEEGIFTKFVNSDTKDIGFQNIYNARAKIVNEYNMYKKSLPETIKLYNNFFDSSDPEIVKQRNDIEVVVGKLGDFEKLKGDFEAAGDSGNSAYSAISDKFSYQLENTMKHMLFNGNFSDDMLTQIDNALNKENVKNALQGGPTDVKIDYIKSVHRFVAIESKAGKEIADGLGVSVKNQLTMDKKHIVAGCTEMKNGVSTDDPAYADVESIASDIGTLATKQDAATISTNIDALTVSDEVKNYLHYMLKKKTEMTKRNSVDIYKNINDELAGSGVSVSMSGPEAVYITKIASMKNASDSVSIRNLISSSTAVANEVKIQLYRVLDEQTDALKNKERRDSKSQVINVLENTKSIDIETWAGKISEIDEKITSDDVEKNYHYKISGVRNPEIKKYLLLRLKDQLTKVFINHIKGSDTFVVSEENPMTTMNEIRTFMRKVSSFAPKYIDEWQKQQCLDAFGEKVGNVFEAVLKNLEEGFLDGTPAKLETVRKLLYDPMQKNGFKEYFDAKTPFSIKLEERLKRIHSAKTNYQLMQGIGTTGYTHTIVDADAEYNKKMLKIFFSEDRGAGNSLVKMMQNIRKLAESSFVPSATELKNDPERLSAIPPFVGGAFDETQKTAPQVIFDGDTPGTVTNIDYNKSFVYNMIRTLNSTEFDALSPKDKIATIYVMRKYVVAMFRSQLAQFKMKFKNQVDNHEFINKHEDQITVYMGENWKKLAGLMDEMRNEAASELSPEDEVYADNVSFAQIITNMCDSTQFLNQIQESKTMGM